MTSPLVAWRKSTFSGDGGTGGGDCVEAAKLSPTTFALRDSKSPTTGTLHLPTSAMTALLTTLTETV